MLVRVLHTALFPVYSKELLSIVFNGFGPAAPRHSQVGPSCFTLFELQIPVQKEAGDTAEWYSPDKANVKTRVWVLRTKKAGWVW